MFDNQFSGGAEVHLVLYKTMRELLSAVHKIVWKSIYLGMIRIKRRPSGSPNILTFLKSWLVFFFFNIWIVSDAVNYGVEKWGVSGP